MNMSTSGLVVKSNVAIVGPRVRFSAGAVPCHIFIGLGFCCPVQYLHLFDTESLLASLSKTCSIVLNKATWHSTIFFSQFWTWRKQIPLPVCHYARCGYTCSPAKDTTCFPKHGLGGCGQQVARQVCQRHMGVSHCVCLLWCSQLVWVFLIFLFLLR